MGVRFAQGTVDDSPNSVRIANHLVVPKAD
jgi:hypothetical protein